MGKPAIPNVPRSSVGTDREPFDKTTKEVLEILMGRRGGRIEPLPTTGATVDQVAAKVNEIIARLQ